MGTIATRGLADDAEKEVLLKTALWNQNAPYNNLCPKISGSSTPTGCVATALAIVMKYNRWPDPGKRLGYVLILLLYMEVSYL